MSLVFGRGPLGPDRAGWFSKPVPDGLVYIEPHPRRVQAIKAGATVIDTEAALMAHQAGRPLSYLFPADIVGDLPGEPEPLAPGYVRVPWDSVDVWVEEGRELVHYPPNPYHRVDCLRTRRRLQVTVSGITLVDTDDTVIVYETALAPRLYVAPHLVRTDLLRPTDTSTYCNYKGSAGYWAAVIGETAVADVAWSYADPRPESTPIKGFLSFDPERAEVIAELIELAKEVAAEGNRGQRFTPPLSSDELSFYDSLATNESALTVQGESVLAQIARELWAILRRDVKTDWTVRDDVRAKLRSSVKRLLVKYKYPPDQQPEAIRLVIEQLESMAPRMAAEGAPR